MAVMLMTTIKNFIGLSTDGKPTDAPVGSTFFEYDTKNTYKTFDGTNWTFFDSLFQLTGMKATTIDLHQAAGTYDLYTATAQNVWVNSLIIRLPNIDCSDDAALTGISIQTNDGAPQVLLAAALGVKANLTAEKQFVCNTPILLVATKKIQLTIIGGTATDDPTTCDVVAVYQAVVSGGYLA